MVYFRLTKSISMKLVHMMKEWIFGVSKLTSHAEQKLIKHDSFTGGENLEMSFRVSIF